jgi:hypothetical protein
MKFLVASLAGITSVLLMMLAPSWYDLQFIAACVSLVVAAYWAGQTYGTLVEMAAAGDYEGRQTATKEAQNHEAQDKALAQTPDAKESAIKHETENVEPAESQSTP